jgi:Xaa-Pro aminopeptidase
VRRREAENRTIVKLLAGLGVDAARVSWDFPVSVADALRAAGVALTVDGDPFDARRRVKSPAQLDGIRRAQAAADTAMGLARDLVHACPADLTAEAVRAAMRGAAGELGCDLPDDVIVAVNGQAADGHESGHGPITAGDHVLVDIWPRDRASRCWADMTRTFMAGGATPDAELQELWALCRRALKDVTAAARPGMNGSELYGISADVFEAAGKPTTRNTDGQLEEGYFHSLGHGVGLDVHEAPGLGLSGDPLVAGDVIAVEPGCYRKGYGGVRLEDLLLVTADGCEVLTQFPYEL